MKAAVEASAQELPCPEGWQPLSSDDERERCYGLNGRTSFFVSDIAYCLIKL